MKRIYLVSGKLRSGKNQFSDYLEEKYTLDKVEVVQDCFAQALKDGCKEDFKPLVDYLNKLQEEIKDTVELYNWDDEFLECVSKMRTKDENFYENKNDITRILLQLYGTEIFRKRVNQDHWVKLMIDKIKKSDKQVFIITDVRFPNEINLVKNESDFDVISIRVERDIDRSGKENEHESETALDTYNDFDHFINNNGTLENLWNNMDSIYNEIK